MKETLNNKGVIIARCWQGCEHYVLITKIDDAFAYIFDPYYLEEDYYSDDEDVAVILYQDFTHNRLVKIERLFDESEKDFSFETPKPKPYVPVEKKNGEMTSKNMSKS
jgi:hypothetical protein